MQKQEIGARCVYVRAGGEWIAKTLGDTLHIKLGKHLHFFSGARIEDGAPLQFRY